MIVHGIGLKEIYVGLFLEGFTWNFCWRDLIILEGFMWN